MHVTLIDPATSARVAETIVAAGDFFRFVDADDLATVATVWNSQTRGKVCEFLRYKDLIIPTGKREEYELGIMDPWFVAIARHLGAEHLQFGEDIYEYVLGYEASPEYFWQQWAPVQVAKHDLTGVIFRKSNPSPGLVRYTAVEQEMDVLDGLEHFRDIKQINDDIKHLLVRHGQAPNFRYYPLPLILRGINNGRRSPAEHRTPGRSRPPMTWLRYKRRTVLDLIPQPK